MTYEDLVMVLTIISNSYPNKFNYPKGNEEDDELFEATWLKFLEDYPVKVVTTALRKLTVNQPTWPPTVGELVREIENIKTPAESKLTAGEAWEMVLDSIRRYGTVYNAKQAMDSLPKKVQKAVTCVGGIRVIGMSSEEDTFMMNRFMQVYDQLNDKYQKHEMLPRKIREDVEKLAAKFTGNALKLESGEKEAG